MRSILGRAPVALALPALTLLLASAAGATDVVVYGPDAPSPEGASLAESIYRVATESDEGPAGGAAHVLDLPFPSRDPLWFAGDLLQLPCADSTLADVDPAAALEAAIAHIDELDHEKGLLKIDQGIRALPCTSSEVTRQTLIDLHFFQAMAHYDLGNQPKAKRGFEAALAVRIDMPWKTEYPPAPQALFLEAKSDLLSRGTTTLGIDAAGSGVQALSVDGSAVMTSAASELTLYRGRHLVRYVDSGGIAYAALVDVGEEGGSLISREALRTTVLNLAWGGVGASAGRIALGELARNRGADRAIVVIAGKDDDSHRAFSFDVNSGSMMPLAVDGEAVAVLTAGKKKRGGNGGDAGGGADTGESGRVGLVVGGGVLLSGTEPYGMGALRVHFRLVKGLELGVGGELGATAADDTTILLPAITFDGRYRLDIAGVFHPYFGGRGWLAFSHDQTDRSDTEVYMVGMGGGAVGFDVTPGGGKGFLINVDIGVGAGNVAGSDEPQLHFTVGGGVGFRL